MRSRDFPGSPMAKTPHSNAGGPGLIPGQRARSHMLQLRAGMLQLKRFLMLQQRLGKAKQTDAIEKEIMLA